MNKTNLINKLASDCNLSKSAVQKVLNALAEAAYAHAATGFTVPGICRLSVREKPETRCRNPMTGEWMLLKARPVLKITALKKAMDSVAPRPDDYATVIDTPQQETPQQPSPQPEKATSWFLEEPSVALMDPIPPGTILFSCPQCGGTLSAEPGTEGMECQCPDCSQNLTVPQTDTPAAHHAPLSTAASSNVGDFITFVCHTCRQEIEAPVSMAGATSACPACGTHLSVPKTSSLPADIVCDPEIFSRTIRIDLSDLHLDG